MEAIPLTRRQRQVAEESFGDSGSAAWDRRQITVLDPAKALDMLPAGRKRSAPQNLRDKVLDQVSQMPYDCTKCNGTGNLATPSVTDLTTAMCPACRGTGKHLGLG